jgi:hypothetical protein
MYFDLMLLPAQAGQLHQLLEIMTYDTGQIHQPKGRYQAISRSGTRATTTRLMQAVNFQ